KRSFNIEPQTEFALQPGAGGIGNRLVFQERRCIAEAEMKYMPAGFHFPAHGEGGIKIYSLLFEVVLTFFAPEGEKIIEEDRGSGREFHPAAGAEGKQIILIHECDGISAHIGGQNSEGNIPAEFAREDDLSHKSPAVGKILE